MAQIFSILIGLKIVKIGSLLHSDLGCCLKESTEIAIHNTNFLQILSLIYLCLRSENSNFLMRKVLDNNVFSPFTKSRKDHSPTYASIHR